MPSELPPLVHDPRFRARRVQNWLVLGLLYSLFYMSRYNFAAIMGKVAHFLGLTNVDTGTFETVMPLVYGLSVVLNGPIADRIGGKKAFLFGALGVMCANLLFGLLLTTVSAPAVWEDKTLISKAQVSFGLEHSTLITLMVILWGINGYFQSFGALSIVKVNAQWFHIKERGTFSGIFGVLIRLGLLLAFSGVPAIASVLPIQFAFILPALLVGVFFVLNLFLMVNSPKDAGFEGFDTGDEITPEDDRPVRVIEVLGKVFASRVTWTIAICSMMIGFVRRSTVDVWFSKYFSDVHLPSGTDLASFAPYQATAIGIATLGILGGFAFGIASDRIFQARRAPVIVFGFLGMALVLALFGVSDMVGGGAWTAMVCLSLLSFFVNGAHGMVGGAASMDFGGRRAAATAAGLFDGMQYLASSFVGILMGWLLDTYGWKAWQWAPIPFAVVGCALMATLWNVTPKRGGAH
jgi:OPA family glycerol-3-phosphate transporter-like MFS transporter